MKCGLVIFDFDGVLVDSERISHQLLCKVMDDLGLKMSLEETLRVFKGRKLSDCLQIIELKLGHALPVNFENVFRTLQTTLFQHDLQPVEGVAVALEKIKIPKCVASNGPQEKINSALRLTGLASYFSGAIFSAYEVGIWKPDPGLFLEAAKSMGVSPSACSVIEDSVIGVQAGMAAGMKVFGYAPLNDEGKSLKEAGAQVFDDMKNLPELLFSL